MNGDPNHHAERSEALQPTLEAQAVPLVPGPFFRRVDWSSAGLTTALTLAIYWVTLAPEITLQFSGEFSVSAMYPGEPFPPGYPLWTVYAWLFACQLPGWNIARRVAMSSAVAGALTCGVIALLASRGAGSILAGIPELKRLGPKAEQTLRVACGGVAGLALGLDSAFWSRAVVVDPWPLSMLLLAMVLCLLMRWLQAPERRGCLYAAALVYGLTLTNSQALAVAGPGLMCIVLLGAPALGRDAVIGATLLLGAALLAHALGLLAYGLLAKIERTPLWRAGLIAEVVLLPVCVGLGIAMRGIFTDWKAVLASGTMLALGLSVYLLLPFFSATNPPLNYGYARTVEGFVHTLTRGQFESVRPTDSFGRYAEQLWMYGDSARASFGVIYALPVLILFWFFRRLGADERRWMLGLLAVFLCLTLLMIALLNPSPDRSNLVFIERFYCASHLILAIWVGYGLALLGTIMTRAKCT